MKHLGLQHSNKNAIPSTPAAAQIQSDTHRRSHAFRRFLQSYRLRAGGTNDGTKAPAGRNTRLQCHNKSSVTADLQTAAPPASSPSIKAAPPSVHCNGIHAAASHLLEHAPGSSHLHLTAGTSRGTPRDGGHHTSSHTAHSSPASNGKAVRCAIAVHDRSGSQVNIALATHRLPQPPPDPRPQPPPRNHPPPLDQPRAPQTPKQVQHRHRLLTHEKGPQDAAAMLTTQIQIAPTWTHLRDLLVLLGPHLNHIHLVAMLCRLAALPRTPPTPRRAPGARRAPAPAPAPPLVGDAAARPPPPSPPDPALSFLIRELAARTHAALPDIDPPGVAGAFAALAALSHHHYSPALTAAIQRASVPWMASLAPAHLVSLLWAAAVFRRRHQHPVGAQWLDTATFCIAARLNSLSATHLARTLYALALLNHRPGPDWLAAFFQALVVAAPAFNPQDHTNVLYSLGVLRLPLPAPVLPALDARLQQLLPDLGPQNLSNVAWAWGRLRHSPPSALRGPFLFRSLNQMAFFHEQHLANLLWGLTTARMPLSKGFQDRCWKAVRTRLKQLDKAAKRDGAAAGAPGARFGPRAFCSILWSSAVLGYRPKNRWLAAYFQAGSSALRGFTPQGLATTVWALGELGYMPNDEWMFDLGQEVAVALPRCRPVDLVQLLCGFRSLKQMFPHYLLDDGLLDRMVAAAVATLPAFNASQTAALLAAACTLYQKPSMRAMLTALAHLDRQLPQANAYAVSNAVWALGKLGGRSVDRPVVLAQAGMVARLLAASRASLPRCNSVDLVQQVVGWAELRHHPGLEWLQQHEAHCYRQLVRAAQSPGARAPHPGQQARQAAALPGAGAAQEGEAGRGAAVHAAPAEVTHAGQQLARGGASPLNSEQSGHLERQLLAQQQPPQQQQQQWRQQQQQQAEETRGGASGGRCSPGFTTKEACRLAAAYQALGYEVQHPVLQRLIRAAVLQQRQKQQLRQQQRQLPRPPRPLPSWWVLPRRQRQQMMTPLQQQQQEGQQGQVAGQALQHQQPQHQQGPQSGSQRPTQQQRPLPGVLPPAARTGVQQGPPVQVPQPQGGARPSQQGAGKRPRLAAE